MKTFQEVMSFLELLNIARDKLHKTSKHQRGEDMSAINVKIYIINQIFRHDR